MNEKIIPSLKKISDSIIQKIGLSNLDVVNIIGDSGSGKSAVMGEIYEYLKQKKMETIILKGDSSRTNVDFYPLDDFINRSSQLHSYKKKIINQALDDIPKVGKYLKLLIDDSQKLSTLLFQNKQRNILKIDQHKEFGLHLLSKINKRNNIFILCEDIQYFDAKTICYFHDINTKLKASTRSAITFITTYNTTFKEYVKSPIEGKICDISISLPKKDDIRPIMEFFGLRRDISEPEIEMIYTCTGGHLYLLYSITEYLNSNHIYNEDLLNSNTLVYKILSARLLSFGNKSSDAKNILCCMSYIGDYVSKKELSCVLDKPKVLNEILNVAIGQNLIKAKDDFVYFASEIIKDGFDRLAEENISPFYSKFSSCIKSISPAHYAKRAILAQKMRDFEQADILFSLYACLKMRNGSFSEISDIKARLSSNIKNICNEFIVELNTAYRLAFEGKNREALSILSSGSDIYPYPLWIEKQYLICSLQYKNNIQSARYLALGAIKELVSETSNDEIEIWARCAILELVIERELNLLDDARHTRMKLQSVLSRRIYFDREASRLLHIIELFSDTIDTPLVAHAKLKRLVSKLENSFKSNNYDLLFDLYIAESNLSGNSLMIGEYQLAYESAEKALRLIEEYSLIRFSHMEVCLNNMYLSLYFMNYANTQLIMDGYKRILNIPTDEDKILTVTNYAGLLITQEKYNEALDIINSITQNDINSDIDYYYAYYYEFNCALALYFNGHREDALLRIKQIEEYTSKISPNIKEYYIHHYQLVITLLQKNRYISFPQLINDFNQMCPEYNSIIWNKFKFVYLFSDLQIWTQF